MRQRKAHKPATVLCESQVLVKVTSTTFRLCIDVAQHLVQESALLLASSGKSEEVLQHSIVKHCETSHLLLNEGVDQLVKVL